MCTQHADRKRTVQARNQCLERSKTLRRFRCTFGSLHSPMRQSRQFWITLCPCGCLVVHARECFACSKSWIFKKADRSRCPSSIARRSGLTWVMGTDGEPSLLGKQAVSREEREITPKPVIRVLPLLRKLHLENGKRVEARATTLECTSCRQ